MNNLNQIVHNAVSAIEQLADRRPNGIEDCTSILPYICDNFPDVAVEAFDRAASSRAVSVRALAMTQLILIEQIEHDAAVRICEAGVTDTDETARSLAFRALLSLG